MAASIPMPRGEGSTTDPPREVREGTARTFPCEQCGADLTFHIGQQSLHCGHCGMTRSLTFGEDEVVAEQDFDATLRRTVAGRREGAAPTSDLQEVGCESCGAKVAADDGLTVWADCLRRFLCVNEFHATSPVKTVLRYRRFR